MELNLGTCSDHSSRTVLGPEWAFSCLVSESMNNPFPEFLNSELADSHIYNSAVVSTYFSLIFRNARFLFMHILAVLAKGVKNAS